MPEEKVNLKCNECGKVFKLSPHSPKFATLSVACPKCASEDVDLAPRERVHPMKPKRIVTCDCKW